MKPAVGYLINYPDGLVGERGFFYDYILAGNGLFIEAQDKSLEARIPVERCEVRGLAPLENKVILTYGSIPKRFFELALDIFLSDISTEHYVAVKAQGGYEFYMPIQDKTGGKVAYEVGDNILLDIHSHGIMGAHFSGTDNKDELGMGLFAVVGRLDKIPVVKLRVGVYGYFEPLFWNEIFDGELDWATEFDEKEVSIDALQSLDEADDGQFQHNRGRLWWNRWFRRGRTLPAFDRE